MPNADPKQSIADAVYTRLRDRILNEDLQPGDALPGERKLSEQFGVNRGAVREGLRRLAHARLVSVQHGGATRVLDYRHAGLDLLRELVQVRGISGFVVDVLELRETLAPLVARRAAERGGAAVGEALSPIVARIEAADDAARYPDIRAFWRILGEHTGNLALRLSLNSLQEGAAARMDLAAHVLQPEIVNVAAYRAVADAVKAGDGPAAAAIVARLVAPTLPRARQLSGELTAS